jgi:hypothetical protein
MESSERPEIKDGEFSEAFYAMIGRAISDVTYRAELLNPETREAAMGRAGLVWSQDLHDKIDQAAAAIDHLAEDFGNSSAAT